MLNTATPPALCKLCWRTLEARTAPGRALSLSLSTSQSTEKEVQGWLQGLLLSSLAALIPACVLHLFRGLKIQNPAPFLFTLGDLTLSDRNALLSAPCYRKTEVHVWRTATILKISGDFFCLFYVLKKAYSCFIRDFPVSSLRPDPL